MIAILSLLLACTGASPGGDTGPGGDGGSDGGGTGTDGGATTPALLRAVGEATVGSAGYQGTERLELVLDKGQGDVVCAIEVPVQDTAPRSDCSQCTWAYDLSGGEATVSLDERCADAGLDAASASARPRSYGFAQEFIGHSDVLMVDLDDRWQGVAYAGWDQGSGAFSYTWELGPVVLP